MIKLGYLGPKGTFSQEAAEKYINGRDCFTEFDMNTISDVISAVNNGILDEAIVPIENSLDGAINVTMDMIALDVDLKIQNEVIIDIIENLIVKEGTKIEDIEHIISHPQPIGQCTKYITDNFPKAKIKYVYSTAEAALEVANSNTYNLASIGPAAGAKEYGLQIIKNGIQDGENNRTRFAVLSKKDSEKTGKDKSSIVFSTENKPGSLFRALDIFGLWDLNMTRIESRPSKSKLGEYIFFIDFEGHRDDQDVKDALKMIKRKTTFYKFLGSYPKY